MDLMSSTIYMLGKMHDPEKAHKDIDGILLRALEDVGLGGLASASVKADVGFTY